MVTGAVVLQLEREGLLMFSEPVSRYVPDTPRRFRRTSIRQLLQHTSRVPDYLKSADEPLQVSAAALVANLDKPRSASDRIARAARMPRSTSLAGEHDYSNTNYVLLERVIEAVTGKPFQKVVDERVIGPLHLGATTFPSAEGQLPSPHLKGYVPGDSSRGPFTDRRNLADVTEHHVLGDAEGSLVSTAADLSTLLGALVAGKVSGGRPAVDLLRNAVSDHDGFYRYGPGIMELKTTCGRRVVGHDGRDLGLYTRAFADPASGRRMVIVVNTALDGAAKLEAAIEQFQNDVFCR
jgi:D-alanyl-D-alanine carboxypeptidase